MSLCVHTADSVYLCKVAIPNPHPDWLPDAGWKDMQVG